MFGLGELPKGYNAKVHGPYDPAVYYGPKDTPFGEVKVGELPKWLARRDKSIVALERLSAEATGGTATITFSPRELRSLPWSTFSLEPLFFYLINYTKMAHHRRYKYHW